MDIRLYKGFDKLCFGDTRNDVLKILGKPVDSFYKYEDDDCMTDEYDNLFIYYKKGYKIEAVEFFGESDILIDGEVLLNRPFLEVLEIFKKKDDSLDIDEDGFTSIKFGFSIYAPSWEEDEEQTVESVLIFEKGYYSDL